MTAAQRRRLWAIIGSTWDKDIGEYIVYAFMLARFGKNSTKALTQDQIQVLFEWLEAVTGDNDGP